MAFHLSNCLCDLILPDSEPKCSDTPPDRSDSIDDDSLASRADIQDKEDYVKFFKENAKNCELS